MLSTAQIDQMDLFVKLAEIGAEVLVQARGMEKQAASITDPDSRASSVWLPAWYNAANRVNNNTELRSAMDSAEDSLAAGKIPDNLDVINTLLDKCRNGGISSRYVTASGLLAALTGGAVGLGLGKKMHVFPHELLNYGALGALGFGALGALSGAAHGWLGDHVGVGTSAANARAKSILRRARALQEAE